MPAPLPHLPPAEPSATAQLIRQHGKERGEEFYLSCLIYAQTLWQRQLPAQTILFLNRAFGSTISDRSSILEKYPLPYQAVVYCLQNLPTDTFHGNPRRHWQHLATRMSGHLLERRRWRAWACWYLSTKTLPHLEADRKQITEEGIIEPDLETLLKMLENHGINGEKELFLSCIKNLSTN